MQHAAPLRKSLATGILYVRNNREGDDVDDERHVIVNGRAGIVMVKDTLTGDVLGTWFNDDALLNATEMLVKLREAS